MMLVSMTYMLNVSIISNCYFFSSTFEHITLYWLALLCVMKPTFNAAIHADQPHRLLMLAVSSLKR